MANRSVDRRGSYLALGQQARVLGARVGRVLLGLGALLLVGCKAPDITSFPDYTGGLELFATYDSLPTAAAGSLRFAAISAGDRHTCGITLSDELYCWGSVPSAAGRTLTFDPQRLAAGVRFVAIDAGYSHDCALDVDGAAWCWGENQVGQLGDGTTTARSEPVRVLGATRLTSIGVTTGGNVGTSCAVSGEGAVFCWGAGELGALGATPPETCTAFGRPISCALAPQRATATVSFAPSGGGMPRCALANDGSAYCWGANLGGALGLRTTEECSSVIPPNTFMYPCSTSPIRGGGGLAFRALDNGTGFMCGIVLAGETFCWGANAARQLGADFQEPFRQSSSMPVLVAGAHHFVSVSAGAQHACALTETGVARCWGSPVDGVLGNGRTDAIPGPVEVMTTLRFRQISAGADHTCAIALDGGAWCWGHTSWF